MDRTFILIGALAGFIGVALAPLARMVFGRDSRLKCSPCSKPACAIRCTTRWHCWRSARSRRNLARRLASLAGWSFTAGILLFSGSLYLLALTDVRILGAITPLGGVAFLIGWACLAYAAI